MPLTTEWGRYETLTTVSGLARSLMHGWPMDGRGDAYITALMVCEAVLSGGEDDTADHARETFIDAAYAAGLSVFDPNDGPDF
ncbi:DUF982 domain-containing protein [Rhizobium sp. BK376]|uniref:DUF982 domain-containing protein n=1 Tax=Rhizobium sp. BK376 TaxID=2512149 RepID=UPI0010468F62|nr:DUF982 domain-containing protein [Rhizobium sp. BK376]TCR80792.1 uncharacterized protein DUF982 [Rhizobium sp. BK376]